jgi:hypothetical protein
MIKPIPVVGSVFAVSLAAYEIKRKGLVRGVVHVGLDVTPFVGTAKGVVEIFTGDLIPDKRPARRHHQTPGPQLPETHSNPEAESAIVDLQTPADAL